MALFTRFEQAMQVSRFSQPVFQSHRDQRISGSKNPFPAVRHLVSILLLVSVCACSAVPLATGALNVVADKMVGKSQKSADIRLKGSDKLNSGEDGKPLSVIVRLFQLKEKSSFLATPQGVFGHPDKEKQAMGDTLVETKEILLSPGQTIDLKEKLNGDALYIGVVVLFRSPTAQSWRFAFDANDISWSGIAVEVHNCAMTSTTTAPVGMTLAESKRVPTAKCNG